MEDSKEPLFEQLPGTDFDLDEIMRRSVDHFGTPIAMLDELVTDIPDVRLPAFARLVQRIYDITDDYLIDMGEDRIQYYPLLPDLTRAEVMSDGRLRVPIADRYGLQRFLQRNDVCDALNSHYSQNTQDDSNEPLDDKDEIFITNEHQTLVRSEIINLPVTVKPVDTTILFDMVWTYYLSEIGKDKYIWPADTLEDIAKDAPTEMLIPLILAIEENFPHEYDDGSYDPVVMESRNKEYLAKNGVVWEVYRVEELRQLTEHACQASEPTLDIYNGFDGEKLNERFYEELGYLRDGGVDLYDNNTIDDFVEEGWRRYDKKHGKGLD